MKYTEQQITNALAGLDDWHCAGDYLNKSFVFKDFKTAFAFMVEIAEYAEHIDHHPDWSNRYKKVVVHLTTHSAKGITALDFELARKMDQVAGALR